MAGIDEQRLRALLGGAELAELRRRLRTRYERDTIRDEFTLTELAAHERRALDGLLGRRTTMANSIRLRSSELDAALERAGVATSLQLALEFLDGPLLNRKAVRILREQEWRDVLLAVREIRLCALLDSTSGNALLKRLAGGLSERAQALLDSAERVLARLPASGVSRAQLAAEVLGDAHALDNGRAVSTLVLRATTFSSEHTSVDVEISPTIEESYREQWARLGVTVNELALPVLSLNLPFPDNRDPGEPVHISLRSLLRQPTVWNSADRVIYVCENPNVVAIAADIIGRACAPLVCTDGMPAAAQQTLLAQLRDGGALLRYHGDFDWAGIKIANFVIRQFRAQPWRFDTTEYLAASGDLPLGSPRGSTVEASWDSMLAAAMEHRQVAIHEEAVIERLLMDLSIRD